MIQLEDCACIMMDDNEMCILKNDIVRSMKKKWDARRGQTVLLIATIGRETPSNG